jgi:hypothetical protein
VKARCGKDNLEVDKKEKREYGLPGMEQFEELGSAEGT